MQGVLRGICLKKYEEYDKKRIEMFTYLSKILETSTSDQSYEIITRIFESSAFMMIQTMSKHPGYNDDKIPKDKQVIPDLDALEKRVYNFITELLKVTETLLSKRDDQLVMKFTFFMLNLTSLFYE